MQRTELISRAILGAGLALTMLGASAGSSALIAVGAMPIAARLVQHAWPKQGLTNSAVLALAAFALWSNAAVVFARQLGLGLLGAGPLVVLVILAISGVIRRRGQVIVTPIFALLLCYGAALTVSVLFAGDPAAALVGLTTFMTEGLILWLVFLNTVTTPSRLRVVILSIVSAAAFLGAISIIQVVTRSYDNAFFGFAEIAEDRALELASGERSSPRVGGPFREKNRYAQMLLVTLPLAFVSRSWHRRPYLNVVAMAVIASAAALTLSRGALLALVAMAATAVLLRLISVKSTAAVAGLICVGLVLVPGYLERIQGSIGILQGLESNESVDGSTLSRVTENIAAVNVFRDHPVSGVGSRGFGGVYEAYAERIGLNVREGSRQPHNLLLGIAAETGLLGLVTFLAVVGLSLRRLLAIATHKAILPGQELAAAFVVSLVGYLGTGIFLHLSFERYLWIPLVCADVFVRLSHIAQTPTEDRPAFGSKGAAAPRIDVHRGQLAQAGAQR